MAIIPRRRGYATDVTEAQWRVVAPLLARPAGPGRPARVAVRQVLNALLYQARTGCPWRLLPQDFPHWTAVRYYFDKWAADGTWEAVNGRLVEQTREQRGRAAQPTAAHADETGWREAGQRRWLWVVVTAMATVFRLVPSRGRAVIQGLLGAEFAGYL